jgi:cellulose synthase/poly-beta-1,6-N-acetylglucosamine synthase-like glycosyltransferase
VEVQSTTGEKQSKRENYGSEAEMLATSLNMLLLAAAILMLIPVTTLALQIACSIIPIRRERGSSHPRPSTAIIIPAHNESATIQETLASVRKQMNASDRLIVVADNCVDDTADVSCSLGAEVIERNDISKIGKAYALNAGLRFLLATGERSVVVFIDADCILGAGALDKLVQACTAEHTPVQARYRMMVSGRDEIAQRISAFAYRVNAEVRPSGYHALGLPCFLMGTGMALPMHVLKRLDLTTGHITEDIVLTVRCAFLGRTPVYCPEAIVVSKFAPSDAGRKVQKTRWVHGHLAAIFEFVPALIREGVRHRDPMLWAMAADLLVPPLGLLGASVVGLNAVTILWWFVTSSWAPVFLTAVALLLSILSLGIAWLRAGRDLIALSEFAAIFPHISKQLEIAAQYIAGRRSEWVRSEREEHRRAAAVTDVDDDQARYRHIVNKD